MKVPGKEIAHVIAERIKKDVAHLKKKGKKPQLTTILIGDSPEQISFVTIKKKVAERLGISFEFVHLRTVPMFEKFAHLLKEYSQDPKVTGVIIQQPLPTQLQTDSIYKYIPRNKEIESHRSKSPFYPPLGLAILTMLKYVYLRKDPSGNLIVDVAKDRQLFKSLLKHKKVVLIGRGTTGGKPIGKALSEMKINYLNVNSQTHQPEQYYKEADIIVTAVGKKIITTECIKPGVILINAGLRKEQGKFRGDYDEKEVKKIALYYTKTPGGVGPLDVLYLYKNLVDAAKMQV